MKFEVENDKKIVATFPDETQIAFIQLDKSYVSYFKSKCVEICLGLSDIENINFSSYIRLRLADCSVGRFDNYYANNMLEPFERFRSHAEEKGIFPSEVDSIIAKEGAESIECARHEELSADDGVLNIVRQAKVNLAGLLFSIRSKKYSDVDRKDIILTTISFDGYDYKSPRYADMIRSIEITESFRRAGYTLGKPHKYSSYNSVDDEGLHSISGFCKSIGGAELADWILFVKVD